MKLKKIVNNYLPFKNYIAMTIYPFIFVRPENLFKLNEKRIINHETIHAKQQIESFILSFSISLLLSCIFGFGLMNIIIPIFSYHIITVINWISGFYIHQTKDDAYQSIIFEKEAFDYDDIIEERKSFGWISYIWK